MADANPTAPRATREEATREASQRTKIWQPPTTLPTPAPQDGWMFRWIRTSLMGVNDVSNVAAKRQEGWEPVKASDHPELMISADPRSPNKDYIEVGGLLLCKAPKELGDQRRAYYAKTQKDQMDAVNNNYMQAQTDSRMPVFNENKRTKVSFGKDG